MCVHVVMQAVHTTDETGISEAGSVPNSTEATEYRLPD